MRSDCDSVHNASVKACGAVHPIGGRWGTPRQLHTSHSHTHVLPVCRKCGTGWVVYLHAILSSPSCHEMHVCASSLRMCPCVIPVCCILCVCVQEVWDGVGFLRHRGHHRTMCILHTNIHILYNVRLQEVWDVVGAYTTGVTTAQTAARYTPAYSFTAPGKVGGWYGRTCVGVCLGEGDPYACV